jgi:hypothetical protein
MSGRFQLKLSFSNSVIPKIIFEYLNILKLDTNGKITIQLYDKRNDFNLAIVNFPYLCSNIPASPAYGYIYRSLFDMQELARHTISFKFKAIYWQISWCRRGFNCIVYRQLPQFLWSIQRSYLPIQHFFGPHAVWYVSYQLLRRSWHTDLDYVLSNVEIGLTAGVTGQQRMITPPWHLIPSLIYSGVRVRPFSDLYFL